MVKAKKLYHAFNTPSQDITTYVEESVLTGRNVDLTKVNLLLFDMSSRKYWSIGVLVGNCWYIGKTVKPEQTRAQSNQNKQDV
jgi:hypothetical protein